MIKNLSEKDLAQAFFYALKVNDFEHAFYMLKIGAPVNTSFFITQDQIIYTISKNSFYQDLVVLKVAQVIKKNGNTHSKSHLLLRILDLCLEQKPDLRCHCTTKNPHYCALSQAFKFINFSSEDDLFTSDNLLVLKLLFYGATYKNLSNSKEYKWVAIDLLNSYLNSKKDEVIELLKTNRHAKIPSTGINRHTKCAFNVKIEV